VGVCACPHVLGMEKSILPPTPLRIIFWNSPQDIVVHDKIKCYLLNCGWWNAVFDKYRITPELMST